MKPYYEHEAPRFLYHKVLGLDEPEPHVIADTIEGIIQKGLVPRIPDEWNSLLPHKLQTVPIVWLAARLLLPESERVLRIDTERIDKTKLTDLRLPDVDWSVYEGVIPPEAIDILIEEKYCEIAAKRMSQMVMALV